MKLIIGLGNPGKKYENTRHNVGFMMVDLLRECYGSEEWQDSKFHGLVSKIEISLSREHHLSELQTENKKQKTDVLVLKPTTFMNLSGESVASIVNFYKLDPKTDILIVSDDLDMEFGKVRYRPSGSSGGQKGIKSIIEKLGTDEISRIKIGIGRDPRYEVSDWVLSKFTKEEGEILRNEVSEKVEAYIEDFLYQSPYASR